MIKTIKKNYSYFQHMEDLKLIDKQEEKKKSKFFLENENIKYVLTTKSKTKNKKVLDAISNLRPIFGNDIPKILYKDPGYRYFITNYVKNGNGKSLYKIDKNQLSETEEEIADKVYQLLQHLHQYPVVPSSSKSWYLQLYSEFYRNIKKCLKLNILTEKQADLIMDFLKKHKDYFKKVNLTYIHGDFTPKNICYDFVEKEPYFIDFDMFQVGDPFIDVSKLIWSSHYSPIFEKLLEKYYYNYNSEIHMLYVLKIKLFWIPLAYRRKLDGIPEACEKMNHIILEIEKLNIHTS